MIARSGRGSVTLWAAGCLVLVIVVAVTGLGGSVPALEFRQAGHWVYNSTVGAVFHIDGGSKTVDNRMALPGLGPANQVVQDDKHGYVVDRRNGRVLTFGKSDLSVDSTLSVGSSEEPASLEVNGGPYLVYQRSGRIIRLGQPPATINVGGPLRTPVATSSGTVWVQRSHPNELCTLPAGANTLTCPDRLPSKHGALTVVDDRPAFVDTTAGTIRPVDAHGLGRPTPLGVKLPADAQVSSSDAGGRLPVLTSDPARHTSRLLLLDTSTVGLPRQPAKPITVPLHAGSFDPPTTSGGAVALLNNKAREILTYTNQGAHMATTALPKDAGTVQVSHGEDGRVYIDTETGTRTFIVDGDGSVTAVTVGGGNPHGPPASTPAPTAPPVSPPTQAPKSPPPTSPPAKHPKPTKHPARHPKPTAPPTKPTKPPRPTVPPAPPVEHHPAPPPTAAPPTATPPTQPPTPPTQPPSQPPAPVTTPPAPVASPPGAPASVTAAPGDGQATVTWTAPDGHGSPITSYQVSWQLTSGATAGAVTVPGGGSLHSVLTGLHNGTTYIVSVQARNGAGDGPAARSASFVPNPQLTAPAAVHAHATADGSVSVAWQATTQTTHGAVRFTVEATGGQQLSTSGTTAVFTGLAPGRPYRFTVSATDGAATLSSAPSAPVTPYHPAAAPTGLHATPGAKQVSLSWAAPDLGGGTLVEYVVSVNGTAHTTTAPSATISGLTAGQTYSFSVHAVTQDPNGTGQRVEGANAAIQAAPMAAPTVRILSAYLDHEVLTIHVAVDDAGSPATCQVLVSNLVNISTGSCSSDRPIVIDNFAYDDPFTLSVVGTNAAGAGPPSNTYSVRP